MKSFFISTFLFIVALSCSLQSCNSSDSPDDFTGTVFPSDPNTFYVIGYEKDKDKNIIYKYWVDGKEHIVETHGKLAEFKAIAASGGNVYVCGKLANESGQTRATLWTNGVAKTLAEGSGNTNAYKVRVEGSDVYVAGFDVVDGKASPAVWKNGTRMLLNFNSSVGAGANALYVKNGISYAAGFEHPAKPVYWINAEPKYIPLGDYDSFVMKDAFVSGADVYSAATVFKNTFRAHVWKNSAPMNLTLGTGASSAESVYVYGSDVYVTGGEVGSDNFNYGIVWKNGVPSKLQSDTNSLQPVSIYVLNGDVYVLANKLLKDGGGKKGIVIFKNGKEFTTLTSKLNDAEGYDMMVVAK